MSRSTRTLIAVMLFVLAGFLILNNIVQAAPGNSWLLPAVLIVIGGILLLYRESDAPVAAPTAEPEPMVTLAAATMPKPVAAPPPAPALAEPVPPVAAPPPVVDVPVVESEPYIKEVGEAEPEPAAVIESHPATYAPVVEASASTATTGPDDLTIINGIGPKMQAALQAAGYDTFAKLAVANPDDLRAAVAAAGMRLAPTIDTWPDQARELASR